jgi:hypothetical protein
MMAKKARYIDDIACRSLPHYNEPQPLPLKVTNNKETLHDKVPQVEATALNEEEMTLVIKRFKIALKGRKDYSNKNKSRGKCACFKCGKTGHFIANYPVNDDREQRKNTKGNKIRNSTIRRRVRRTLAMSGTQTPHPLTPTMKDS